MPALLKACSLCLSPNPTALWEALAPRTSAEEADPSHPQIGIQNYSTTSSCQARASQVRSDYGTLFVVLVVIGAICVIIIVLGLLYNCWQRRLPKLKHVVSMGSSSARWLGLGAGPVVETVPHKVKVVVLMCRWGGRDCPGMGYFE